MGKGHLTFVAEHTGNMAKYVNAYLVAQRGCAY